MILRAKESDDWKARILLACQNDILFWIKHFCWTKDPRPGITNIIPFLPYEFQEELILKVKSQIETGKDLLIEKSRDMGVTWCFLYVFMWFWLFKEGYDFLLGSQTQDDVDQSGNPKSLFPRIRMNLQRQPKWMLPVNYQDNFLRLVNSEKENTIVGEANTVSFSRQGRFSGIMLDEFAFWKESGRKNSDEQAWMAAGDASPCRMAISTPNPNVGKNCCFYKIKQSEMGAIEQIKLHWKLHPLKTQQWYEEQKKRRSPVEISVELDMDWSGAVSNRAAENWNPAIHIQEYKCNENLPLELCCDFNIDPMCWSVAQTIKGETYTFKEYSERTTITENVIQKFCRDFISHKNKFVYIYGDPSGTAGNTKSRRSDYDIIKHILRINKWEYIDQIQRSTRHADQINYANKRLRDWENDNKVWEFIDPSCKNLIESIEQTKRKDDGIDKDGMEHHFQAWAYRIESKSRKLGEIIKRAS